jgi:uncharacterized protein YjeT (DUF2065 family)
MNAPSLMTRLLGFLLMAAGLLIVITLGPCVLGALTSHSIPDQGMGGWEPIALQLFLWPFLFGCVLVLSGVFLILSPWRWRRASRGTEGAQ